MNPITPINKAETLAIEAADATEGYVHRDLVALDVFVNVIAGGVPDETISSRLSRDALKKEPIGVIGSEALDLIQKDHGAIAQASDVGRAKDVIKLEESAGDLGA